MSRIIIRDYRTDDYPAVNALWEETGLGGAQRGDDNEVIDRSLRLGGKMLIAQLDDGRIAGTSWMTFDGRRLHLHHVGVSPSLQGHGIGRLLSIESIRFARERNIQVKLEVHRSNRLAVKLYQSLGFTYLGDYDVYIIREHD